MLDTQKWQEVKKLQTRPLPHDEVSQQLRDNMPGTHPPGIQCTYLWLCLRLPNRPQNVL